MANAQIIQHLRPGGIESLALSLLDSNPDDYLIALQGDKASALAEWPKLELYQRQIYFLNKPEALCVKTVYQLAKLLKELNIAAIHTHHIGPYLYGALAAKLAGIARHVHTEHDGWHLSNNKHRRIQTWLNRLFQPQLVADAAQVADVVATTTGARSQVIYNGVDTFRFAPLRDSDERDVIRAQLGLDSDKIWVGSAGRLEAVKGHRFLIEALQSLSERFCIVIAGEGSLKNDLVQLALTLGVSERVVFLGHTDQMLSFYRALDVFCLPSLNEGFPLAPLEAQACGIRTIVTDVGGSKEALCPITGRCVPAENPSLLATAITDQYLSGSDVSPARFVQQHFSLQTMSAAYQQLLSA